MIPMYEVWSTHPEPEQHDLLETRRTDKQVAEDDALLINERLSPL
jgi:hypothetical protein